MKEVLSSVRFVSLAAAVYLGTLMLTETAGLAEAATFRFPGNTCQTRDDDNDAQYDGMFQAQSDDQHVWCAVPSGPDLALSNVSSVTIYGAGGDGITSRICVSNTSASVTCGSTVSWTSSTSSFDLAPLSSISTGFAYVHSQDVDKYAAISGIKVNTP